MASSHILFTEEELESDILKYGATNKDGSFTRGFSYFKQKMDLLGQKVEEIASAKVIDFVREELRDPNIKEAEIFKILNDKN